jgi:electron transfer flavoprotein beta subunit
MNSYDQNAMEAALQLKSRVGGQVTAISMGPAQFSLTLREALAMGGDEAILLSSGAFAGADTLATAYVLAKCVERIGGADLILLGCRSVDSDTGQVGPIMAELLNLPQVTLATRLELTADGRLEVDRLLEKYEETVSVRLPALVAVTSALNTPRYPRPVDIMKAARANIEVFNETYLECEGDKIGLAGSRTEVVKLFRPHKPDKTALMIGSPGESSVRIAAKIAEILTQRNVI